MKLAFAIREPQVVLESRTCCKCGAEFLTLNGRVCPGCRQPANKPRPEPVKGQRLSPRERQVADLVVAGLQNKLIADRLKLTEGTIKVYLFHMFRKFGVGNRTELAVAVLRMAPPDGGSTPETL